jgi:hypothetical protein
MDLPIGFCYFMVTYCHCHKAVNKDNCTCLYAVQWKLTCVSVLISTWYKDVNLLNPCTVMLSICGGKLSI